MHSDSEGGMRSGERRTVEPPENSARHHHLWSSMASWKYVSAMVMKEDKCANLYVSTPRHSNSAASRPGRAAASRPHGSHAARC